MAVPGPPNITQLPFASPNTLEFKWGPPLTPNGTILGYRLTINGTQFLIDSDERYYSVTGLINGQTYSTSLEALNANGWGAKANFINFQPGSEPTEGPSTFTVVTDGSNASLRWTPPATLPDAPIQWYGLYAQDSYFNYNFSYSANGFTQSNFYIQNLSSMAYYYDYSNYAVNCPGWSPVVASPAQRKRGTPEWATYIGGTNSQSPTNEAIATDINNNVYIIGEYIGTTNIYNYASAPVNGGNVRTTLYGTLSNPSATTTDTYFIKYNSTGTVEWVSKVGFALDQFSPSIKTDTFGNVFISGVVSGSTYTQFYNYGSVDANSTISVTVAGNMSTVATTVANDIYLAKYNSSGIFQWAATIGSSAVENSQTIATDPFGNVFIAGIYNGTPVITNAGTPDVNLNIATTPFATLNRSGGFDIFLAKYDPNGAAQWATRVGNTQNDTLINIKSDSYGGVYMLCSYSNLSLSFFNARPPVSGVITPTLYGNLPFSGSVTTQPDIGIVKYNSAGSVDWVTRVGSALNSDFPTYLTSDSSGNAYISAQYYSGTAFTIFNKGIVGSTSVSTISLTTYGTLPLTTVAPDLCLIKYDSNGTPQWATRVGGSGLDRAATLTTDISNNIYLAGLTNFSSTFIYNKGTPSENSTINTTFYGNLVTNIPGTNINDVYLIKYDSDGNTQWATALGKTINDANLSLSADSIGNVYLSGIYNNAPLLINNTTLSPTINNSTIGLSIYGTLPNDGGNDQFLIKFQT